MSEVCECDREMIDNLSKIHERIEEIRWQAIFAAADAQEDHSNREPGSPVTLVERLGQAIASVSASKLGETAELIERFLAVHKRGGDSC